MYKIAIFGSATNESNKTIEKAKIIGKELARSKAIVINGATSGIPYVAAYEAYRNGAKIWGFSPASNLQGQKEIFPEDKIKYSKLIFIPKNYQFINNIDVCRKYRNVTSTATCDAGIIIAGRWGTMNEFTNLKDMGKVIGVLTGSGGIADEIKKLNKKINKESLSSLVFDSNPKNLVSKVLKKLK